MVRWVRDFPAWMALLVAALGLGGGGRIADAETQYSVVVNQVIEAPAAVVWQVVGDFGAMVQWHPQVTRSSVVVGASPQRGAMREVVLADGTILLETLASYEPQPGALYAQYAYVINRADGEVAWRVDDYRAEIELLALGEQLTLVVWRGEFIAPGDGDRERIAAFYRRGLAGLAEQFTLEVTQTMPEPSSVAEPLIAHVESSVVAADPGAAAEEEAVAAAEEEAVAAAEEETVAAVEEEAVAAAEEEAVAAVEEPLLASAPAESPRQYSAAWVSQRLASGHRLQTLSAQDLSALERLVELFHEMDQGGIVTLASLRAALRDGGLTQAEMQIVAFGEAHFRTLDQNGDRHLTERELYGLLSSREAQLEQAENGHDLVKIVNYTMTNYGEFTWAKWWQFFNNDITRGDLESILFTANSRDYNGLQKVAAKLLYEGELYQRIAGFDGKAEISKQDLNDFLQELDH